MKFSRVGIGLITVGCIMVVLAPVWRWAVAPRFLKIPDDIDTTSTYRGTASLSADPQKM